MESQHAATEMSNGFAESQQVHGRGRVVQALSSQTLYPSYQSWWRSTVAALWMHGTTGRLCGGRASRAGCVPVS